ncbi:hypothetical protein [Microbispora sp. NPDC046933]|uniref:hypothetical protein n=1 Tax=Microbispora sp. NPDC046933 TaxID=3155618 RepID=UPI0033EB3C6A
MDISMTGTRATDEVRARPRTDPKGLLGAVFVLGGAMMSLTGMVWDIQWHNDVGPDTFFTAPHLVLYAGSAVAGIASLVVVLATTMAERRGRPVDPTVGGTAVGVFGRTFAAPVGYLISGVGAALFLVYGLLDERWHRLYGFDVVIESPPHIGFLLAITLTMVGAVMVSAAALGKRWGEITTVMGLALLLGFDSIVVEGLNAFGLGAVDLRTAGISFVSVLPLVVGARLLGRPGGAIGIALILAALQALYWWFGPWATRLYADAIGQPFRDDPVGVPMVPALIPMTLLPVAALVGPLLARARDNGRLAMVVGGIGGLVITVTAAGQSMLLLGEGAFDELPVMIATAAAGTAVGVAAGFLGVRFAEILRSLAPAGEGR